MPLTVKVIVPPPITVLVKVGLTSLTITPVSDMTVINETPTGTIDGTNQVFTSANAYKPGEIEVFLNGQKLKKTADYTETSSTTITLTNAPLPDQGNGADWLSITYNKA